MIRKLLATTALASLIATGALAQETTAPADTAPTTTEQPAAPVVQADGHLVSNIIGETVYNGTADDAQNIGKVSDLVFDKDGNAVSAIIGVGGFLGIGAKDVAFDYDKLQWAEKNGDRWLIAAVTKEELETQPAFDSTPYKPVTPAAEAPGVAPTDGTASPDGTAEAPATDMQTAPAEPAPAVEPVEGNLASLIIGESVYNGTGDDAQDIGKVNDVVLSKAGQAESLVIGVGGFLGIGQKNVAFDFNKAEWAERDGDRWLVVEATKESLEALPDFDRRGYDPAPAASAEATDTPPAVTPTTDAPTTDAPATTEAPATTDAPATDTAANPEAQPDATTPVAPTAPQTTEAPTTPDADSTGAIDKSTLTEVQMTDITANDLNGTTVYGADDAQVGEIGDVVLTPDGQVDAVIVDVGGFLGVGSKPVAVGMDTFKVMADKDGKKYLYTEFTKEQFEAHPAYDKDTYAANRDQQRMMVQ